MQNALSKMPAKGTVIVLALATWAGRHCIGLYLPVMALPMEPS
jgi:hypothetical protein